MEIDAAPYMRILLSIGMDQWVKKLEGTLIAIAESAAAKIKINEGILSGRNMDFIITCGQVEVTAAIVRDAVTDLLPYIADLNGTIFRDEIKDMYIRTRDLYRNNNVAGQMQIQYIDVAEHAVKLLQAGLPILVFVMFIVCI